MIFVFSTTELTPKLLSKKRLHVRATELTPKLLSKKRLHVRDNIRR
jgi:hypothetical protein